MEKITFNEKSPEIPKEVLQIITLEVVNNAIEDRDFSINEIHYALRLCPSKNTQNGEVNGKPAEYVLQPDENAIYIWDDLPEKIQQILLFHEVVEIYLRKSFELEETPAHNATLSYEKQFKKNFVSKDEENILKQLRIE